MNHDQGHVVRLLLACILIVVPLLHTHFHDEQVSRSQQGEFLLSVSAEHSYAPADHSGDCPVCMLLCGGFALLQPRVDTQVQASVEQTAHPAQCRISPLRYFCSCPPRAPPIL